MKEWFQNKSVALIGNAMSLFHSSYGKEIDSHDVVVRLNKAAMLINSFDAEQSHGTRTDIWIFWSVHEYHKYFKEHTQIKKMHAGHQSRTSNKIKDVDFIYPDTLYQKLKPLAGSRKNPTTGLIAIDYILHCDPKSLYVYGFDWKKTPTQTDPERKAEKRCPHNYDAEQEYCMNHVFTRPNVFLRKNDT